MSFRFVVMAGVLMGIVFSSPTPVLMYHEIRTPNIGDGVIRRDLSCSPSRFEQHLNWIQENGYSTVTMGQLLSSPSLKKAIVLTFDDGRVSNYWAANELRRRGMIGVFYINTAAIGSAQHLSRQQIVQMSRQGMEIASHTVSHADLRTLSSEILISELVRSKSQLEQLISSSVESLAYPSGRYNSRVISASIRAGYRTGRTTDYGFYKGGSHLTIPVIRIHSNTTVRDLELILFPERRSNNSRK